MKEVMQSKHAGQPLILPARLMFGKADPAYLNTGDPNGKCWMPAETDVSIRPWWFYHPDENDKVKSPKELVNLYYESVGHNSLLLLNIPPNREGLLSEPDVYNIKEFRKILNKMFSKNLATRKVLSLLTDKKLNTFVSIKINRPLVIDFKKPVKIDRAILQENIATGQRIENARFEYWDGKIWKSLIAFTTVRYKRLLRFKPVILQRVRLIISAAKEKVQLSEIGFFKASSLE